MSWDPEEHVGEIVTLRGTAYDARAGAIVMLPDETPIYIAGLFSWDDDVAGQEVEVKGQLAKRPSRIPQVGPDEEQYHGIGETYAVNDASWTVVS